MTDFSRLPFGLSENELDKAFRLFLLECETMTSAETAAAVTELIMRIDYHDLREDIREGVSKVLIDTWNDEDHDFCDMIASGLVNMGRQTGKAFLEKKASCGIPELEALAIDTLREFPRS